MPCSPTSQRRVFCSLGDEKSASWASGLLQDKREVMIGGSMAPEESTWDILMGRSKFTGSFSEQYQPVVRPGVFMHGLQNRKQRRGRCHRHPARGVYGRAESPARLVQEVSHE